jgi:hypothetical protein
MFHASRTTDHDKYMRNPLILLILLAVTFALLAVAAPARVVKPVKDGQGPLAVKIDSRLVAPDYHSPLTSWRTGHMDAVNEGNFAQSQCLNCHNATTSCNNCHQYVGVTPISTPAPSP